MNVTRQARQLEPEFATLWTDSRKGLFVFIRVDSWLAISPPGEFHSDFHAFHASFHPQVPEKSALIGFVEDTQNCKGALLPSSRTAAIRVVRDQTT